MHELGDPLAVYPVGTEAVVNDRTVTFPDGAAVMFQTARGAEQVGDVAARGKAAVE